MTATIRAALLSLLVASLLAACTATGGRPAVAPVPTLPAPPTSATPPTTEAPTTTTTTTPVIERVGADEFSPCELLPEKLGGQPLEADSFSRYLPSEFPSVDLCVGWVGDRSTSIDVGYVAYGSLPIDEMLAEVDEVSALDVGDEAGAGRDGAYWIAAATDANRQLLVRIYDPGKSFDLTAVEEMTGAAWDRLPEGPPSGGTVLPKGCEGLDQDLVQALSGDVVLARGDEVGGALSCGFLGGDADAVLITVFKNITAVDTVRTLGERDGWRRFGAGKLAYVTENNEEVYVAVDDDTLLYLDTPAEDPPAAGSPIDGDRQALLDHLVIFAAFV